MFPLYYTMIEVKILNYTNVFYLFFKLYYSKTFFYNKFLNCIWETIIIQMINIIMIIYLNLCYGIASNSLQIQYLLPPQTIYPLICFLYICLCTLCTLMFSMRLYVYVFFLITTFPLSPYPLSFSLSLSLSFFLYIIRSRENWGS